MIVRFAFCMFPPYMKLDWFKKNRLGEMLINEADLILQPLRLKFAFRYAGLTNDGCQGFRLHVIALRVAGNRHVADLAAYGAAILPVARAMMPRKDEAVGLDDADDIAEFHAAQGTVKPCCKRSSRDVQAARRKPRR